METVEERMTKKNLDAILQQVLNVLETEDGRPFEEKKKEAVRILREAEGNSGAAYLMEKLEQEAAGREICGRFWEGGDLVPAGERIVLRKVCDADRDKYLEVRLAYSVVKDFMKEDAHRQMLWNEHTDETALMFSIFFDHEYVGYCGIHNVTRKTWEIAMELLPEKTNRGIGVSAMTAMLDAIKARLGVKEYRVRIEPTNSVSQKFFERLGAVPNGLSTFLLHDPQVLEACEEENFHLIDDSLRVVAEKFSVEPQKLLSHVLEYKLIWG